MTDVHDFLSDGETDDDIAWNEEMSRRPCSECGGHPDCESWCPELARLCEENDPMTDTEKLAIAMQALDFADGILSQAFYEHGSDGDKWCEVCHRVISSRVDHKGNCEVPEYLELRKELREMP